MHLFQAFKKLIKKSDNEETEETEETEEKRAWYKPEKKQIVNVMTYDPDTTTYKIVMEEYGEGETVPEEAIRVTDTKNEFLRFDDRHNIPPQDSLMTAMDLGMLLDNRDIKLAFDKLTGNGGGLLTEGWTPKKILIYGGIGFVALIFVFAIIQPMLH